MIYIENTIATDLIKSVSEKHNDFIIVTDPPFNVDYHYNSYKDKMNDEDYFKMLKDLFKDRKTVVIHYPEDLHRLSIELGYPPQKEVSWVYNSNTPRQHRSICFYNIKPDFKQVIQPYKNPNDKRIKERISKGILGGKLYDWWNVNQVKNVSKEKTEHPCQMPIDVMEKIVGILPYDSVIVDPFLGSGTTALAVKNMNEKQNAKRVFYGGDIDEKYCSIARERLK